MCNGNHSTSITTNLSDFKLYFDKEHRAKGISHMQICINFDLFAGLLGSILCAKFAKQTAHDKLQTLTVAS